MKGIMVGALVTAVLLTGCSEARSVEYYVDQYGGDYGVYNDILNETYCSALNEIYNISLAAWVDTDIEGLDDPGNQFLGYSIAAGDRMRDLDCPPLTR